MAHIEVENSMGIRRSKLYTNEELNCIKYDFMMGMIDSNLNYFELVTEDSTIIFHGDLFQNSIVIFTFNP